MATTRDSFDGRTQACVGCGRETLHTVSVQMRTQRGGDGVSREPHEVAECQRCGTRSSDPLREDE